MRRLKALECITRSRSCWKHVLRSPCLSGLCLPRLWALLQALGWRVRSSICSVWRRMFIYDSASCIEMALETPGSSMVMP